MGLVGGQQQADNLYLVHEALREERTKRAVAKSGSENFLLGWLAFALEVTAGELAASRELFAVVDSEREEILPGAECGGGSGGNEQFSFALTDGDGTTGEASKSTGGDLDTETFNAYVVFLFHSICVLLFAFNGISGMGPSLTADRARHGLGNWF